MRPSDQALGTRTARHLLLLCVSKALTMRKTSWQFGNAVVAWQKIHGRHDLPWQNTQDPYAFSTIKLHVAHPQPSFYQRQKNLIEDITNLYRKSSVSKVAE